MQALRRPANWIQLVHFCLVGASGYVVNLARLLAAPEGLRRALPRRRDRLVRGRRELELLVEPHWTFREQRGHFGYQGMRFFVVSGVVYCANLGVLSLLVSLGVGKIVAQAVAIIW